MDAEPGGQSRLKSFSVTPVRVTGRITPLASSKTSLVEPSFLLGATSNFGHFVGLATIARIVDIPRIMSILYQPAHGHAGTSTGQENQQSN